MQIGILINDREYREALVERLASYDNDLFVNVVSGSEGLSKDSLILTDIDPGTLEERLLLKLSPRTIFLTTSIPLEDNAHDYHRFFKYSSVSDLLSEASLVFSDWQGIGYGRDHSSKIISVCCENDSISYDRCMSLARQIVYRIGGKVLVVGLGYINDYGCEESKGINRFGRLMYSISTGRHDAAYGYTYTDSYGISALLLHKGKNPLAYRDNEELMNVISAMASMFDTLILDIGTCFRQQNLTIAENSDNIVLFEIGRRSIDPGQLFNKEALPNLIIIKQSGDTEDVMAIDDAINQIYGVKYEKSAES